MLLTEHKQIAQKWLSQQLESTDSQIVRLLVEREAVETGSQDGWKRFEPSPRIKVTVILEKCS